MKLNINGKEFYMDGYLKQNLDRAKDMLKKDWDCVFLIDGYEGIGKSTIGAQISYYIDPTLDINRLCFSPTELADQIKQAKPYQAVIYDEAYTGLSSRSTMSTTNKALVSMLAEIRQKQLFVCVIMPSFFDLDKYVALWRSRALIHVYSGDNLERGFFGFYNMERKKSLYVNGKKFYNYYKPMPNFRGRFTKGYIVDNEEYRKKKLKSLMDRQVEEKPKYSEDEVKQRIFEMMVTKNITTDKIKSQLMGISPETYRKHKYRYIKSLVKPTSPISRGDTAVTSTNDLNEVGSFKMPKSHENS